MSDDVSACHDGPFCVIHGAEAASPNGRGKREAAEKVCPANGSDAKLQAAQTRERTSGAPLAARKERF